MSSEACNNCVGIREKGIREKKKGRRKYVQ